MAMKTKKCAKCFKVKPASKFYKNSRNLDSRHSYCRDCSRLYWKSYYRKYHAREIRRSSRVLGERKAYLRGKLKNYLTRHPCVDCGESDIIVLDFDHVRGKKAANISRLVSQIASWTRILSEIKKCEVVCSNCHRRRTAKRGKWWNHSP